MHEFEKELFITEEIKQNDDNMERYEVAFDHGYSSDPNDSVRQLKSEHLGKLRSFRGTVTRTSEVRPELLVGVFKCMTCGTLSKDVIQQFKYTEPKKCLKNNCDSPMWELDLKRSRFADFQKIRVQEDPTRIPPGAMPRSIDVILRNDNT
jgi:DNA replication licensing factor MCM6